MRLIYQTSPSVALGKNVFTDVPIVLQFESTPLISVVSEQGLGYTTQIPIYHADGTYLAKVTGTRVYATEAGKKAGVVMRELTDATVCEVAGKTVFEVFQQKGDAFRVRAELATSSGYFVRVADEEIRLLKSDRQPVQIGGMHMIGRTITGRRIGVLLKRDGSAFIGGN
jgi:hypothetical protein